MSHGFGSGGGFNLKLQVPSRHSEPQQHALADVKPFASGSQASPPPPAAAPFAIQHAVETPHEVQRKALAMWDKLMNVRDGSDPARLLHAEFMFLPSATDYPNYYAVIGDKALALDTIRSRIARLEYQTLSQVKADFAQVFDNAKMYNVKGSQIYMDAKKLKKTMRSMYARLTGQIEPKESKPLSPASGAAPTPSLGPAPSLPPISAQTGPVTLDSTQVILPDKIPGTSYATRGPTIKPWLNRKIAELLALADKQTGRFFAEHFQTLPSRSDEPEFYRVVERPIAFDQIQTRNHRRKYETVPAFVKDVTLLLQNALAAYPENTQRWRDAKLLEMHFARVMAEQPPEFLPPRKYNTAKRKGGPDDGEPNGEGGDERAAKRPKRDDSESVMPDEGSDGSDGSDSESESDGEGADHSVSGSRAGSRMPPSHLNERSMSGTPGITSPSNGLSELSSIPHLHRGASGYLFPDIVGSPQALSPMTNGSPTPALPPPDLSKPQLVAKITNKPPLVSQLIVSASPPLTRPVTLNTVVIKQHSIGVPVKTERVEILLETPPFLQQPQMMNSLGINGQAGISVNASARPPTVALTSSNEPGSGSQQTHRFSFTPKMGLTTVEFIVKPHASVPDSDADVYRCFIQRG
ncbi:hypothetical protein OIO90_000543 [Microbotryomycetes sp. JL221]|nr:hypothetical protein OIO90_000543 [Microbotryomycetes sp. JL221]